ncbi:MAG: AAA family ATPase, partial [Ilumatobacteraceae bacterium]
MADLMSSRFVGRRRELDALRAARDAARNGRGTLVAIVGDPGIGKTRLVEECLAAARDESFVTAWGSGWPDGDAPPFWPWHEVLAQFNAADGVVTLEGARSAHDGGPDRFTMYRSTHAAIERAAAMRPALIVLDDAHAIDPSALALA